MSYMHLNCSPIIRFLVLIIFLLDGGLCLCQQDSLKINSMISTRNHISNRVLKVELIAPIGLISYGIASVKSPYLQRQNEIIKENLQYNRPQRVHIDDFTQYASTGAYFALDVMGVEAKHSLRSRFFTATVSHIIMGTTVNIMKKSMPMMRPDFSSMNSFPSGHTATAFVGAELIWQEYRHQSIWYGIGAYTLAAGTGFFRMYNNRHWLSDVVMGAGVGILSTKMAYWMLPTLEERWQKKKYPSIFIPSYNGRQVQITYACTF
ncbi:hypothetical protein CHU00_02135 [Sphingobacterium cellulitidis]|nr:hypothetical protein CHU00_02135 [Sphingobacterium cellulitidis]